MDVAVSAVHVRSIFTLALHEVQAWGMGELKRRWRLREKEVRDQRFDDVVARERDRRQLRAALAAVGVELESLRSTAGEDVWDDGDFSFGFASPNISGWGWNWGDKWIRRGFEPVSERSVRCTRAGEAWDGQSPVQVFRRWQMLPSMMATSCALQSGAGDVHCRRGRAVDVRLCEGEREKRRRLLPYASWRRTQSSSRAREHSVDTSLYGATAPRPTSRLDPRPR